MQHALQDAGFAGDERGDLCVTRRYAAVPCQSLEKSHVVVPQIVRVVVLGTECEPLVLQRLLKRAQVKGLAVGNHPVEVEHDCLEGRRHAPGAFSPARIAMFSRLDGGGNGHSYAAL